MVVALLVKAGFVMYSLPSTPLNFLGYIVALAAGYEFADFGSGVYHWAMDNYGNSRTPIWGKQIEAFQGHHERPWTITHRQVSLHALLVAASDRVSSAAAGSGGGVLARFRADQCGGDERKAVS